MTGWASGSEPVRRPSCFVETTVPAPNVQLDHSAGPAKGSPCYNGRRPHVAGGSPPNKGGGAILGTSPISGKDPSRYNQTILNPESRLINRRRGRKER